MSEIIRVEANRYRRYLKADSAVIDVLKLFKSVYANKIERLALFHNFITIRTNYVEAYTHICSGL